MKKTHVKYRGLKLEAMECPKCGEKIFTEKLAMEAVTKLEEKRLKDEYVKHPIRIGHSWAITFPKEIAQVFHFSKKMILKLHPDLKEDKIELKIEL